MGMIRTVDNFFKRTTRIGFSASFLIIIPAIVGSLRGLLETVIHTNMSEEPSFIFHMIVGYSLLQTMMIFAMKFVSGREYKEIGGVVSVGLVLAFLPPLLDIFISSDISVFYVYFEHFSWLMYDPNEPLGEIITLWGVVFGFTLYAAWLTKSIIKTILAVVAAYIVMQIYIWGWAAFSQLFFEKPTVMDLCAMMNYTAIWAIFIMYSVLNWKTIYPSLKRFNHCLPFAMITLVGTKLVGGSVFTMTMIGLTGGLAFMLVIIANDYFDKSQDGSAGAQARPASRDDMIFAHYLQALMVMWLLFIYPNAFAPIILFYAIWIAYHLPDLRFKRLFCLNYKSEGVAGAACFLLGLFALGDVPKGNIPAIFVMLVMGGFSACSMFKDYKDIEEDRNDKVGTIYTRSLKKGRELKNIHLFVSLMTSTCLLIPAVWLICLERPIHHALMLAAIAILPAILLQSVRNRKTAVESAMYALSAYLLTLALVIPAFTEFM